MSKNLKIHLVIYICLIISSCSSITQKIPDTKPVRLIQKNELNIILKGTKPDCRYLGEIIGSEGHWYTYLFISNRNLMQGALNDIYNRANNIGANVVFISDNISFATSVSFYGQAYHCKLNDNF